ncbi:2-hydroxyacid dehydrogenase [Rhizosaccharibacter radicis]|uniref:D-glycerate dehydrogenase n=1 Tax=Rhizosaccharibacter radicis TaxID=2782605 RepID=A0ABT1VXN5_9PROT|nr:D-glycerate dehydrogenase [Acetobacteraceae bacterium KSS12]
MLSTPASRPRLLMSQAMTAPVMERAERDYELDPPPVRLLSGEALLDRCRQFRPEMLMVTSGTTVGTAVVEGLPSTVRLLATVSVGFDHIDRDALARRGIPLCNTPDVLTECNADLTMLLILGACRRAAEHTALLRDRWHEPMAMTELLGIRASGRTLGIVGMGRIGRAVARRARGFGMRVLYCNRRRLPPGLEEGAEFVADLRDLLPRAQILSLHAPGGPATRDLIGRDELALLPRGAVLVNAARGSLLDEDALFDALDRGHLFAAGLDVFRNEPAIDGRFRTHPRVFATPHVGSATSETRTAMGMKALDNIELFRRGEPPPDLVPPPA